MKTTLTKTLSHTLDLTPKKKARSGKYDQEALDALLAKAENLPEEMTPAMEEAMKRYGERQREAAEGKNNPYKKNYDELLKTLTPDQQAEMKKNIQLNSKGGIDIVPMNIKNMKPLIACPNNETIFDGSHIDQNGKTGIEGVIYLTGKEAESEVKIQSKKLLKDRSEVEQFISLFPGKTTEEKFSNFGKLFDLKKAGYWDPNGEKWGYVESVGYVNMSEVSDGDFVYGLLWAASDGGISQGNQSFPSPVLAFEDC